MLAAVHATEERLIAPRYMMQISAHQKCTVRFIKHLCHMDTSHSESDLH